jgi:Sulfotransferase family
MQNDDKYNRKYVFVCGLPRSGTSVLGRNIGRLEDCTDFKNTGVGMDEGQFLQDVYPTAHEFGGAGRFGFDSRTHRTETSSLLTAENVARLRASWHTHWDNSKTIFVEKTPGNLLMTRFLQAAFPNSYFIVIRRHPVPVGMAAQKWKVNVTSLYSMFEHWLHCHELFEQDKKYLKHVYELRYEDYVENPGKYHEEIAPFLGTRVPDPPKEDKLRYVAHWRDEFSLRVPERAMEETSGAYNKKYFDRWCNLLRNSFFKSYYRYIARKYEPRFAKYGYSLTKGLGVSEEVLQRGGKISNAVGALCCFGADAGAFTWRLSVRSKEQLRLTTKAVLPEFVVSRIRKARQRQSLQSLSKSRERAGATSH